MLKEEKRVTVTLGKREILLFSIALLITYGLVFAFGVEFGKSWMRSLLESQEIASTATPVVPKVPEPTISKPPASQEVSKPAAPVIEVRPRVEKPSPAEPKMAEGGEPAVETPKVISQEAVTKAAEKEAHKASVQVEKAVSSAVTEAKKAEAKAVSSVSSKKPEKSAVKPKAAAEAVEKSVVKASKAKAATSFKKTTVKPRLVGGGYLIQVGAFSKESSAISMVKKLRTKGYHSSMTPVKRNGKTFYKVFVGPYGSETGARHALELLKKREGIKGYLIAPKKK